MSTDDKLTRELIVGISSRALFDLDESHEVFEQDGLDAYSQYQIQKENDVLAPGSAFPLVRKLLAIKDPDTHNPLVD